MIEFIDMIVWIYSLFASALYVAVVFSGYSTNIEDDERKDVYIRKVKPKKGAARPMLTKDNWKSKLLQTSFWHVPESSDKEQHQSFLQYLNPVPAGIKRPIITFSFKPLSQSFFPSIAASVNIRVVS